ncbi:ABC transporter permease [Saxibacter everestensis]|uniref:ABC transporter permease n=1 Tax=Saxibacter everestensis TaxID=2909229 RepID=A0ABY8QSR8_9MICO|nr:ABC transporter permease [Brevibacteriaceae bacterium ZFBP1038]
MAVQPAKARREDRMIDWLGDPANWQGSGGVPIRLLEHLAYFGVTLLIAIAIAIPLGLYVGHTGKGGVAIAGVANSLRALPTLGLLILAYLLLASVFPGNLAFSVPSILVLVVLAVPPILTNTYAGVRAVDAEVKQAGYGMGMSGAQVLWQVEVPNAMPLIMAGVRSSALQIIATATVAAYVSLGGLGRYLIDGIAQRDYPQVLSGAVLVAVLAILVEVVLSVLQFMIVSPGLSARGRRNRKSEGPVAVRSDTPSTAASTSGNHE